MRQELELRPSITAAVKESGDALYGVELLVYEELKRLLYSSMASANADITRNPKTIVAAALAKLLPKGADKDRIAWFYALAASCMRRLLIEHATAALRESHEAHAYSQALTRSARLIKFHFALEQLQARQPLCARIAELHYFAGCSTEEITTLLNMPRGTVVSEFRFARAWLAAASEE